MDQPGKTTYEPDYLKEGLRILARMIARALMAESESGSESEQGNGDGNKQQNISYSDVVCGILLRQFQFINLTTTILIKNSSCFFVMELVALLSKGKVSWAQVSGLMKFGEWDKIILIGDEFSSRFTSEKEFEFIQVDLDKKIKDLREEIREKLKGKIDGTEVALSIASGDGKEHMALISALINLPVGIRFTALTKEGLVFL